MLKTRIRLSLLRKNKILDSLQKLNRSTQYQPITTRLYKNNEAKITAIATKANKNVSIAMTLSLDDCHFHQ